MGARAGWHRGPGVLAEKRWEQVSGHEECARAWRLVPSVSSPFPWFPDVWNHHETPAPLKGVLGAEAVGSLGAPNPSPSAPPPSGHGGSCPGETDGLLGPLDTK